MGILGRINRVIQSNLNELLDSMADPGKEVDLLIFDMEQGLKEARQEVVAATAEVKQVERRVEELDGSIVNWQARAEQAVRASDDTLAREALQKKASVQRERALADKARLKQIGYVMELKESLKALDTRLKDVKLRKESLKQRARAVKGGGESPLSGGRAFAEFDRLEARIEGEEEAQQLAASSQQRDAELEARFARLADENPQVDDELAELKRRMEQDG